MESILSKLSIATITWARNDEEALLLKRSLLELAKLELPIYITDAGSTEDFGSFLKEQPAFNVHEEPIKGVWQQARNSLLNASASGTEYILYTEPDKFDFFSQHFTSLLSSVEVSSKTGVVLFSRSGKAFQTFPAFQQMTETTINSCCAELIGKKVDYTYGPFIINKKIIPHLLQLPGNIGWGWRPFAFNIAKRLGYAVEYVEGNYFCPEDQRQDSSQENIYRMKQLQQNIEGLVLSTTASLAL